MRLTIIAQYESWFMSERMQMRQAQTMKRSARDTAKFARRRPTGATKTKSVIDSSMIRGDRHAPETC